MTPAYLIQWVQSGYVELYVGPRGLELPYVIGTSGRATVLIPAGQCVYAQRIDAHGNALSAKSPEVCPGKTLPPTHILVTKK